MYWKYGSKYWLIVDINGNFYLVDALYKPQKVHREIMTTDYDHWEWDYHGHPIYGEKGTGKFVDEWNTEGSCCQINKKFFNEEIQKRTWEDDPLLLDLQ